ncbi:MAG: hypothetical protein KF708_18675 [Pirellulales bacterium]|nr:hypothetical protein [Pirellulales bacterium]
MRCIDYAVECIQRALREVECDRFTPAVLSPEIADYLIDLTHRYPIDDSEFSRFVITLSYNAIRDELLNQILPASIGQQIRDYRAEYEALQIRMENDVAQSNFDEARQYRDRQQVIETSIRELIAGADFTITLALVESVLRSLAFPRVLTKPRNS